MHYICKSTREFEVGEYTVKVEELGTRWSFVIERTFDGTMLFRSDTQYSTLEDARDSGVKYATSLKR